MVLELDRVEHLSYTYWGMGSRGITEEENQKVMGQYGDEGRRAHNDSRAAPFLLPHCLVTE